MKKFIKKICFVCMTILSVMSVFACNSFGAVNEYQITDDFGSIALADYITNRDNCGGSGMTQLMISDDWFFFGKHVNDNMSDDPLLKASIDVYNGLTWSVKEIQDNPVYYDELMILEIIRNEFEGNTEYIESLRKQKASRCISIMQSGLGIASSTSKENIEKIRKMNVHDFDWEGNFINNINELNGKDYLSTSIDMFIDSSETAGDMIDKISMYSALMAESEYIVYTLEYMRDRCNDNTMETALDKVIRGFENSDEIIGNLVINGAVQVSESVMLSFADAVIGKALVGTPIGVLIMGKDIGKFISDNMFSTDELVSLYKKGERLSKFESLCKSAAKSMDSSYKSSVTAEKGKRVNGAYDLLYRTCIYDMQYAVEFIDAVNGAPASVFYPDRTELLNSAKSRLSNLYLGYNNDYGRDIGEWLSDRGYVNLGSMTVSDSMTFPEGLEVNINGNLTVNGNVNVNGTLNVSGGVAVLAGTVNINGDMTVGGDYEHSYSLYDKTTVISEGCRLDVKGNFSHSTGSPTYDSYVYVNGSLYVGGNYYDSYDYNYSSINLYMNNEGSYMEVKGNFTYKVSGKSNNFTKGVIAIGGNYSNSSELNGIKLKLINGMTPVSISAPGLNISGITSQNNITMKYVDNKYTIDLNNQTINCGSISINKNCDINVLKSSLTGSLTIGNKSTVNINGDMTVGGDVTVELGTVNINGNMTVGGNYEHSSKLYSYSLYDKTTVISEGCRLDVKRNFSHYTYSSSYDSYVYVNGSLYVGGNYDSYGYSSINLYMNNESSYMEVKRNFTYKVNGKSDNFTKGVIAIGGNYNNRSELNGTKLKLINGMTPVSISAPRLSISGLCGEYSEAMAVYNGQSLSFDFGNSGISFTSLSGSKDIVLNNISSITGEKMTIYSDVEIYCDRAEVTGDITVGSGGNLVLEGDYAVNGNYTISGNGVTTINHGSSLSVKGDFKQTGTSSDDSELYVPGSLNVDGNYSADSYSKLAMQLNDSKMVVLGDFTYNGSGSYMTKGNLDVGGSFSSKNPIRTTVTTDLKTVEYNITIADTEGIIVSDHTEKANFADEITININSENNRKYYVYIADTEGNIIKKGIGGIYKFNMPNKDVVISAEYVGFETGDIDMDGSVSKIDAATALRHISNISLIDDELKLALADADNDGNVNITDVTAILNISAKGTNVLRDTVVSGAGV